MLAESSAEEVAWLWWVDIDTLVVNATAEPPVDNYDGKDFVAWGHGETLLKGDMQNGAASHKPSHKPSRRMLCATSLLASENYMHALSLCAVRASNSSGILQRLGSYRLDLLQITSWHASGQSAE